MLKTEYLFAQWVLLIKSHYNIASVYYSQYREQV